MTVGVRGFLAAVSVVLALAGCSTKYTRFDHPTLTRQVFDTERAFAQTMADRDYPAFTTFLADEAVFFSGKEPARGNILVSRRWKRFFTGPSPPFSWQPEKVEVLESGTLALSSGPVRDANGKLIGTFTSIWRQEKPGVWRIIFDKGCDVCEACPK